MKRLLSLVLAGGLLLSMAGCGGEAAPTAPPAPVSDATQKVISPSAVSDAAGQTVSPSSASDATGQTISPSSVSDAAGQAVSPSAAAEPGESPQAQEEDDAVAIPAFTTTDLEGSTVTEDIFSGKDLTVVNVWATYCGPCVNEMPELGRWAGELPDNVQLIGIVGDVASGDDGELHDLAVSILEEAEADFPCLTVSDDLMWILYSISGVPTTFFVDGEGNIVGEAVLGAYVDEYKSQVEELLHGTEE